MFRSAFALCFVFLMLCSAGCRMCSTPHDYRISAYIDRCEDYRGFNPVYRAGSIFGGYDACPMIGNVRYVGMTGDVYNNAGNYGVTTSALTASHGYSTRLFDPQPGIERQQPIGIPETSPGLDPPPLPPGGNGLSPPDYWNRGTSPLPTPPAPPARPSTFPDGSIPFSPSDVLPKGTLPGDEVLSPPSTVPRTLETDEPPITLEELRRLDPSIKDVQIISIEDAASVR